MPEMGAKCPGWQGNFTALMRVGDLRSGILMMLFLIAMRSQV
jgi:hypothetical protein